MGSGAGSCMASEEVRIWRLSIVWDGLDGFRRPVHIGGLGWALLRSSTEQGEIRLVYGWRVRRMNLWPSSNRDTSPPLGILSMFGMFASTSGRERPDLSQQWGLTQSFAIEGCAANQNKTKVVCVRDRLVLCQVVTAFTDRTLHEILKLHCYNSKILKAWLSFLLSQLILNTIKEEQSQDFSPFLPFWAKLIFMKDP